MTPAASERERSFRVLWPRNEVECGKLFVNLLGFFFLFFFGGFGGFG